MWFLFSLVDHYNLIGVHGLVFGRPQWYAEGLPHLQTEVVGLIQHEMVRKPRKKKKKKNGSRSIQPESVCP